MTEVFVVELRPELVSRKQRHFLHLRPVVEFPALHGDDFFDAIVQVHAVECQKCLERWEFRPEDRVSKSPCGSNGCFRPGVTRRHDVHYFVEREDADEWLVQGAAL